MEATISNSRALRIRIIAPDGTAREWVPGVESVILGSGTGAAVKISDPAVSSLHLLLKAEQQGVTAIDLGSESGTWIGDRRIMTPVALSSADVLRVGSSRVRVFFEGSTPAHPVPVMASPIGAAPAVRQAPALAAASRPSTAPSAARALALVRTDFKVPLLKDPKSKVVQVTLLWGDRVMDVQHFTDGVPVTIGHDRTDKFHVFSTAVGGGFTLAVARGSSLRVNIPTGADVVLSSNQDHKAKPQLRAEGRLLSDGGTVETIDVGLHDCIQVSLDNVRLVLRFIRPSAGIDVGSLEKSDLKFFSIAGACVLGSAAFILALLLAPQPKNRPVDSSAQTATKYVKMLVRQEEMVRLAKKAQEGDGLPEGARAKDKEGEFGRPEAKRVAADPARPGSPVLDERRREEDRKKVMRAGLLGALGDRSFASNIVGPGGLGAGINNALGGLKPGAGFGDASGTGGLGSRGAGTGGGGVGLGLGGLGTKGMGPGSGGYGSIELAGRAKETTRVVPGHTIVLGGLSKEVIARVIRQHQSEIKYCYEVELQKRLTLFGKVAVLFTIDPAGSVSEANVSESSLDNQNTEQCMLVHIRRWKFPEPEGGGIVTVTFPWIFKPAGSEVG